MDNVGPVAGGSGPESSHCEGRLAREDPHAREARVSRPRPRAGGQR
jgi:hypothetical protein